MFTVNRISKSFNLSPVLKDITFSIAPGERVGLIGPNGSGKSTLLRILVGQESPDSGQVMLTPSTLRLGYLSQGFEADPSLTIGAIFNGLYGDPYHLENELEKLAIELAAEPGQSDLQLQYDDLLTRLQNLDDDRFRTIVRRLGLESIDPHTPVGRLSGGQKTRLSLATVLIDDPDILLLDEPTNHLDIAMLEWLEEWLSGYSEAALIVSHDRTFLDRTVSKILDLNPVHHTIREYRGNYSDYLDQYVLEQERQLSMWKDQEYEIARIRGDIARTREQARHVEITTKPNQPSVRRLAKKVARKAASREKKLDRFLASEARVDKPERVWQMKLEFDSAANTHIGREVVTLQELSVGYPGRHLLSNLSLSIQAGERVVLTGPNGSGKTTLLRTVAGFLPPLAGRVRLGGSVRLGYMSQEQELLAPESTALETILNVGQFSETEARSFLHYFLFEGDDPLRPIGTLSYGERSRLTLATLAAGGCTFLILDEPINHLDIPSRTLFENALSHFPGAILAVVHDRYFIDRFATTIWDVQDGGIKTILA